MIDDRTTFPTANPTPISSSSTTGAHAFRGSLGPTCARSEATDDNANIGVTLGSRAAIATVRNSSRFVHHGGTETRRRASTFAPRRNRITLQAGKDQKALRCERGAGVNA